jgi:hypothetical protein
VLTLGVSGVACSDTKDRSGTSTNLDEVGPQLSKLRLEVQQLRQEVRTLQEQVSLLTPATDPETGAPLDTTPTTATDVPAG